MMSKLSSREQRRQLTLTFRDVPVIRCQDDSESEEFDDDFDDAVADTQNEKLSVKVMGLRNLRSLLSFESDSETPGTIEKVIRMNLIPVFSDYLTTYTEEPKLLTEVLWIMTNIAAGTSEQCSHVATAGCIPKLIKLGSHPAEKVACQALWALYNVMGDTPELRNEVLGDGNIFNTLPALLNRDVPLAVRRHATRILLNMSHFKAHVLCPEHFQEVMALLIPLLTDSDSNIVCDVLLSLFRFQDMGFTEELHAFNVYDKLVPLLDRDCMKVQRKVLDILGTLTQGTDLETQMMIDTGALEHFHPLVSHSFVFISKVLRCPYRLMKAPLGQLPTTVTVNSSMSPRLELDSTIAQTAIWILSNIAAGTPDQSNKILTSGIVPLLQEQWVKGSLLVQLEVAWVFGNIIKSGSYTQVVEVLKLGVVTDFCRVLRIEDKAAVSMKFVVLEGLEILMHKAQEEDREIWKTYYVQKLEDCDGFQLLNELYKDDTTGIDNKICEIFQEIHHFDPTLTAAHGLRPVDFDISDEYDNSEHIDIEFQGCSDTESDSDCAANADLDCMHSMAKATNQNEDEMKLSANQMKGEMEETPNQKKDEMVKPNNLNETEMEETTNQKEDNMEETTNENEDNMDNMTANQREDEMEATPYQEESEIDNMKCMMEPNS